MFKQVILGPHITEKSMALAPEKRYIFVVAKEANKHQIAKAVEDAYKVKVLFVKTINVRGKSVRYRQRFSGKRKNWKKAIIGIPQNQTIKEFVAKE